MSTADEPARGKAPWATDADVIAWLHTLPGGEAPNPSIVRQYVRWAGGGTTAPLIYHVHAAFSIMATLLHPLIVADWHGPVYPIHWGVMVGDAGTTFKSTCIKYASEILNAVDPSGVSPFLVGSAGSAEALIDSFGIQETQLITHTDWGEWLQDTKQGIYKGQRKVYLRMYDCEVKGRVRVQRYDDRGGEIPQAPAARHPRPNVLAAVNPDEIEENTDGHFWKQGLGSRFLWAYGVNTRNIAERPARNDGIIPWIVGSLRTLHTLQPLPFAGFTAEADEIFHAFEEWINLHIRKGTGGKLLAGTLARASNAVLRCALILAADYGEVGRLSAWRYTADVIKPAIQIVMWGIKSAMWLISTVATTTYQRDRRAVLEVIEAGQGEAVRLSRIAAVTRLDMRTLRGVLDGIQTERRVIPGEAISDEASYALAPNFVYALTHDGGAKALEEKPTDLEAATGNAAAEV